jgi:hypothetical protein
MMFDQPLPVGRIVSAIGESKGIGGGNTQQFLL